MLTIKQVKKMPRFVEDKLSYAPCRGEGLHSWLFCTARLLHPYMESQEIISLLQAKTVGCGVREWEIENAVQNSKAFAWNRNQKNIASPPPKWPSVNKEQREAVIASHGGLVDLWEKSPVRLDRTDPYTEHLVDQLFPDNPLLCCGHSVWEFATKSRREWRGELSNMTFMVPSPMKSVTGRTKSGKESQRSLDNTGNRQFLVVEQDLGTLDDQASILLHLAKLWPLVMALSSGSKSIHGWFFCKGLSEQIIKQMFNHCVSIGADPQLWNRSQFVRMPDGIRDNGERQVVYYFNPFPLQAPHSPH